MDEVNLKNKLHIQQVVFIKYIELNTQSGTKQKNLPEKGLDRNGFDVSKCKIDNL